jgi:hypothetical protein
MSADRRSDAGGGRPPIKSDGFVRLDREYIVTVRPHLTDRESRVYEAILLECDGWNRPTNAAELAGITRLHIDHVRKAVRFLEGAGLIHGHWVGSPTSPYAKRSFTIVRKYGEVLAKLQALGRIGPETRGRNSPETVGQIGPEALGQNSPETVGRIGPAHLRSRSSLDRSRSLPSSPSPSAPGVKPGVASAGQREGTKEGGDGSVPEELVDLARVLWSTDVTKKAARRYLAPLLRIGEPIATPDELKRFLRSAAKLSRVQRARFPISAACMPEEFEDWLRRARNVRLLVRHDASEQDARERALPLPEIAHRSAAYARALVAGDRNSLPPPERYSRRDRA